MERQIKIGERSGLTRFGCKKHVDEVMKAEELKLAKESLRTLAFEDAATEDALNSDMLVIIHFLY